MIDPLYQKEILRLAAGAWGAGELALPRQRALARNPLCGDQVSMDVQQTASRIGALAHQTRACVLCQASAALLAKTAPGQDAQAIAAARQRLAALLGGTAAGAWPAGFEAFEVFGVVTPHPHRHTCVLLPFDALAKALSAAAEETDPHPSARQA